LSDGPKRIRSIDALRSVRPDPRAEPKTLPPPPQSAETPTSAPIASEVQPPTQAQFRHKLAALQGQVAEVQRLLAEEQRERADEADQLARMLKAVSSAERALAEEREVALQLGKSLTQREEECVALHGRVLDVEQKLESSQEQLTTLERELGDTKEKLIDVHASEGELKRQLLDAIAEIDAMKNAKAELVTAQRSLAESERDAVAKGQELERLGTQLKQAHQRAFTANKQLESWKAESQRAIDQVRKDHEGTIASLSKKLEVAEKERAALATEIGTTRTELETTRARADSMRQHIQASIKILTFTSEALEAAEAADVEIHKVRTANEAKRRQLLEQAVGVRNALKGASEDGPTLEVSEADWSDDDETKS
jgi:chromosome segregation ATPase